jgi:hypothetical protein
MSPSLKVSRFTGVASTPPRAAALSRRIWITWESQRRNSTASDALGCKLFVFDLDVTPLLRYPLALVLTCLTFVRERPATIFVQNPSMILAAFAVAYGRRFRIPVIVDTHNAGIEPLRRGPGWQLVLTRFILRRAALTIVSNQALGDTVSEEPGAAPVAVLADPIPELPSPRMKPALLGNKNVLFVCAWAIDEPYIEVIKAASLLPPTTFVYITGKSGDKLSAAGVQAPPNVVLTGYVDEDSYVALVHTCDVILDLTTWEDCLLCGAYEAVAAERSVILSNTAALKSYFHAGALFTDNTHEDIATRIQEALARQDELTERIRGLKQELIQQWQVDKERVEDAVRTLERPGGV